MRLNGPNRKQTNRKQYIVNTEHTSIIECQNSINNNGVSSLQKKRIFF